MNKVNKKENNMGLGQMRQQLALERINHLSALLCYKYGLDTVVCQHVNKKDFAIFVICECCGEIEHFVTYSLEQLIKINVQSEVMNLIENSNKVKLAVE
jgi:Fe2+ or Zn2+ uptake regulation protein